MKNNFKTLNKDKYCGGKCYCGTGNIYTDKTLISKNEDGKFGIRYLCDTCPAKIDGNYPVHRIGDLLGHYSILA